MKNIFMLSMFILLFFSCSDSTKSQDEKYNKVEFTVNGAEWDHEIYTIECPAIFNNGASYNDNLDVTYFFVTNPGFESINSFNAFIIGDTAGVYQWDELIYRYNNSIGIMLDPTLSFNSLHSLEGQTTINNFPECGKMISGTFNGQFQTLPVMVQDSINGNYFTADTVDISGEFSILRFKNNAFQYLY